MAFAGVVSSFSWASSSLSIRASSSCWAIEDACGLDGLVLDLPTAYFEAFINTPNGALVGQFPSTGEHLGMLFEEGNSLRDCVNLALAEMESDGTLEQLQSQWLADYLNVPVIE